MNKKLSEEALLQQLAELREEQAAQFIKDFPDAMVPGKIILVDGPPEAAEAQIHAYNARILNEVTAGGSNPKQYGLPEGAKELQDLIEYRGMNFAQGNIFKAQYRAGHCSHSDELRDAQKTLWFAKREVERLSNG